MIRLFYNHKGLKGKHKGTKDNGSGPHLGGGWGVKQKEFGFCKLSAAAHRMPHTAGR